ncbi:MAG: GMC family oxidoreductase [Deltaproteobacteria bacterium]|nr:GMC family oxidoreductase [Deltaproteobacteria bacterium]
MQRQKYDLIIVGTGFASTFFLHNYLNKLSDSARILILERGKRGSHQWRIKSRKRMQKHGVVSSIDYAKTYINTNRSKDWVYSPAFGGGSNCWWAATPRFHPSDFRLKTKYNVGVDWPIDYDELEAYYDQAERIMSISGESNTFFKRSRAYPQEPHNISKFDQLLRDRFGDLYFAQPCARPTEATDNRKSCCASGVCNLCPVDAKFTIENELSTLYDDQRIELLTSAYVSKLETKNEIVTGVVFQQEGKTIEAEAELVVLGANAIFNPYIMQRSGMAHPLLGKGLTEQISVTAEVLLDGVDNFQGSTSHTAHGYMLYDGRHREEAGACLIESSNIPKLRLEKGKHRQIAYFKLIVENLPEAKNQISSTRRKPKLIYESHSEYGLKGIERAKLEFEKLLQRFPIEKVSFSSEIAPTESHILGTTIMGDDPKSSVIDKDLVHHKYRNLLVLGGGAFPTISPANPTLTICALSLRAAKKLGGIA